MEATSKEQRLAALGLVGKVFDQSAETTLEVAELLGISISHASNTAQAKIRAGEWEQVWKRVNGKVLKAYRRLSAKPD